MPMSDTIAFFNYCADVKSAKGFHSIWSADYFSSVSDPHPFPGAKVLVHKEHWGDEPVRVEIHGPTYLHLWAAADKAIVESGDLHHAFIEKVVMNGNGELEMYCGS